MLRFSCTTTRDMHIGDLRIALFNYIVSQQKNQSLVVRVEDINGKENIEGKDKEILETLSLFGIEYSHTVYQSQNFKFYSAMAIQLLQDKKAFSCFCSDEWINKKKQEAKEANKQYKYDDACANLPDELVIDNLNPFRIRIKKPLSPTLNQKEMDSFTILNQDKTPVSCFASAVDDMLNDIDIVVDQNSYKYEAVKEEYIRTSLGYEKHIESIYLPDLFVDSNIWNIKELLKQGFLPEAILNYLISITIISSKDIISLNEAVDLFDVEKINKTSPELSIDDLKKINREVLLDLDAKELSRYVGFADSEIGELARFYLKDVYTTKELKEKLEPVFSKKIIPVELKEDSEVLIKQIKEAPYFDKYDDFKRYMVDKSNIDIDSFDRTFSYILTGSDNSTDIAQIYKYLKNYIVEIVK